MTFSIVACSICCALYSVFNAYKRFSDRTSIFINFTTTLSIRHVNIKYSVVFVVQHWLVSASIPQGCIMLFSESSKFMQTHTAIVSALNSQIDHSLLVSPRPDTQESVTLFLIWSAAASTTSFLTQGHPASVNMLNLILLAHYPQRHLTVTL